jgi:hypothetical protein
MEKYRAYAVICHVGRSRNRSLLYESAYCDAEALEEAKGKLADWVRLRKNACSFEHHECGCESIIVDKLTPDIIASGALENIVEIEQ